MRRGLITSRSLVAVALVAALAAGCSDPNADSGGGDGSGSDAAGPVSTLPPPEGDPIVLAMITQESGPAALPDSRLAAEAAVEYVNTELGGAAGRPLELQTCVTDGSPEQSSACANELLEQDPVAFVGETELGTAGSVPIIEQARVPLVGAAAFRRRSSSTAGSSGSTTPSAPVGAS